MAQSAKVVLAEKVASKAGPEGLAASEVVKHAPKSVQGRVVNITTLGRPGTEGPPVQRRAGTGTGTGRGTGRADDVTKRAKQTGRKVGKHARAALFNGAQYERAIKAEWLAGIALMWCYPIIKPGFAQDFGKWIQRQIAWTAVFIALLLVASISDRWSKFCAGFGGLVLLALLVAPFGGEGMFGASVLSGTVGALTRDRKSSAPAGPFGAVVPDTGDLGAPPNVPVGGGGGIGAGVASTGATGQSGAPDDGVGEMSSPGLGSALGSIAGLFSPITSFGRAVGSIFSGLLGG